ncbi:MAG: hypothetical protein QG675_556 [Patescibacteria group bacterium]|jgi:ABC-type multidrug transport system fused ATPase/permease subunit|nr:hypothetical protein [Patescibacteria group bacterium]
MQDKPKTRKPLLKYFVQVFKLQWQLTGWRSIIYPILDVLATLISIGRSYIYAQIINLIALFIGGKVTTVFPKFWYLVGIATLAGVAEPLIRNIQDYFMTKLDLKAQYSLNLHIAKRSSEIDAAHFEDAEFQNTLSRVEKLNISWVMRSTSKMISDIVTVLIASVAILQLNWVLFVLAVISTLPRLISSIYTAGSWRKINLLISERRRFNWHLRDVLMDWNLLKEIRPFMAEKAFLSRMRKNQNEMYDIETNAQKKYSQIQAVADVTGVLTAVLTRIWLFYKIISTKGIFSIGDYTFYDSLISRLENSSTSLVRNFKDVYEELINIEDYFVFMNAPSRLAKPKDPIVLKDDNKVPSIEFENVSFTYPNTKKQILHTVSFKLESKEKMALIGVNGAGKTTITKLLLRFYDPTEGRILIDGMDLRKIDLNSWYKKLAIISQDFHRYPLTVGENISFDLDNKPDSKRLKSALNDAQAGFVKELAQQENTRLTRVFEDSVELSGGQWQKIALARAFYKQSPILVLDEPTSAIDARAEAEIFHRLWKRQAQKGAIVISHRFSTVREADNIVVIDHGKIIEQGTHADLMKNKGVYHELFTKQAKSYQ